MNSSMERPEWHSEELRLSAQQSMNWKPPATTWVSLEVKLQPKSLCFFFKVHMHAQSLSHAQDPMNCSPSGSSVHATSQAQEYWSELPFPSPEDLPIPETKLGSPALQVDSLPLSHQGSPGWMSLKVKLWPKSLNDYYLADLLCLLSDEKHGAKTTQLSCMWIPDP